MHWIRVNNREDLPKNEPFLALWKGAISLSQYEEDEDAFYISFFPAVHDTFKVAKDRENKFTHFMKIERPEDY